LCVKIKEKMKITYIVTLTLGEWKFYLATANVVAALKVNHFARQLHRSGASISTRIPGGRVRSLSEIARNMVKNYGSNYIGLHSFPEQDWSHPTKHQKRGIKRKVAAALRESALCQELTED
jgi:hypothetical protein